MRKPDLSTGSEVAIGVGIGAVLGVLFGDATVGVATGVALGATVGAAVGLRSRGNDDDSCEALAGNLKTPRRQP